MSGPMALFARAVASLRHRSPFAWSPYRTYLAALGRI